MTADASLDANLYYFRAEGYPGAGFARLVIESHRKSKSATLVCAEDSRRADVLIEQIRFFDPSTTVLMWPDLDVMPYLGLSSHPETIHKRLAVLRELVFGKTPIVVAPLPAALRRLPPKDFFTAERVLIKSGDTQNRDTLISKLVALGYLRSPIIEERGQFAVRGDILDVFAPQNQNPVRISFFDDNIESIREFAIESQRTAGEIQSTEIILATEIPLSALAHADSSALNATKFLNTNWQSALKKKCDEHNLPKSKRDRIADLIGSGVGFHGIESFLSILYRSTDSLFSYLPKDSLIAFDTLLGPSEAATLLLDELSKRRAKSDHDETIFKPEDLVLTTHESDTALSNFSRFANNWDPEPGCSVVRGNLESNLGLRNKISAQVAKLHSLAPLVEEIDKRRRNGVRCHIVCHSSDQAERVKDLLGRFDLPIALSQTGKLNPDPLLVQILVGGLDEGFFDLERQEWWIADEEIFGKKTRRATTRADKVAAFSSFAELTEGDFVIHLDHGVGVFRGLTKLAVDANKNDFVLIEYAGGDKLYLPVDRLHRLQRFSAEDGIIPTLDKLGGSTWKKVRDKAKKAARKLAAELLRIQAVRDAQPGFSFPNFTEEMEEFAASFEFDETPDQEAAIADVVVDMAKSRPMDRLICGDVGFGKTEVAMRAVYQAVLAKKQVAVLVPTTVLGFQHFTTFKKRFENYSVNVELISRYRTLEEQKDILAKLKTGEIDVIVGTHRLLSQDIKFRDLGLLVIDEEHRFGVIHKEKIKKMRALVDVLTLTATPIPRTLNFALNGIRDLSLIRTPPTDRLAVVTNTCSFDPNTLAEVIRNELARQGQIYIVHNRVQSIEKITKQFSDMVPEARIRFAHGQMGEGQLEDVMIAFMNREFDILVATTIVESGLDIPNANTMIINRADALGLAQLYQLRGRVGRADRQAYCYLVVPEDELITNKAKKRLATIRKFTELGSGFKVASHDLEIRGAGNILGDEQSGHIAAIGYDMYVSLLQEAINDLRGTPIPEDFEPEISLNVPAKIPEDFIADETLRLTLYKQVSSCLDEEEIESVRSEWRDRFGSLLPETHALFELVRVRLLCRKLLISSLKFSGGKILMGFHAEHRVDTGKLATLLRAEPQVYNLARDGQFCMSKSFAKPHEMLFWLVEFLRELGQK